VIPGTRGLDWHNFFVANVQTGFGPFIAVYLSGETWTDRQIGIALSVGTIAGMASQLPAGALVDALANKRLAAFVACLALMASALLFAAWPVAAAVYMAEVLHGFSSTMLVAAIAAMSLALVGRAGLGERLGRNGRFAAAGSSVAAAVMGAVGTYVSERAVFVLTAALMLPALAALAAIPRGRPTTPAGRGAPRAAVREAVRVLLSWRILVFAGAVVLFHLGNAAMLPIVAGDLTKAIGTRASLVIAACIVGPQILVAAASPWVGSAADRWGRRPVLMITFLAVPVRGALLALVDNPIAIVLIQCLDGVSAAGFGVMLPLIAADFTHGTNRFNLCMGVFGLAAGFGATLSTGLAGAVADRYGHVPALFSLAAAGLLCVGLIAAALPETQSAEASVPA